MDLFSHITLTQLSTQILLKKKNNEDINQAKQMHTVLSQTR